MVNDYFGKWVAFQRQGKVAVIQIENDNKKTGFKVFDNNGITKEKEIITKFENLFKLHNGKNIKVIGTESRAGEYEGKLKASELLCFNLVIDDTSDPIPPNDEPAVEREASKQTDDESDLPF